MNRPDEPLATTIHRFAAAESDGALSADGRREFHELLRSSAEARRTYLQYIYDTASLRWMFSGPGGQDEIVRECTVIDQQACRRLAGRTRWMAFAVAAALACVAAYIWYARGDGARPSPSAGPSLADGQLKPAGAPSMVATVTDLVEPAHAAAPAARMLSRVATGEVFRFSSGALELTFDSGARVKVFGPAEFEIVSEKSIRCTRGRVTTLVGQSGKGFTIETPQARIVDLGTEFGVDVSEQGDTQVVVFQGSVDLTPREVANSEPGRRGRGARRGVTRRLEQGDALMLASNGTVRRVVAVERRDFFPPPPFDRFDPALPVIVDVRDNLRPGQSTKCYQIVRGGLREDALCFADRTHQWNGVDEQGLPEFLVGADYIMPFNDDKFVAHLQVEVQVARPAFCYIFLDNNMIPPPWLVEDFHDTGYDVGLDGAKTVWHPDNSLARGPGESVDFVFSVWRREIDGPGTVKLGGVTPPKIGSRSRGFNMYGIALAPR